MRVLVTGATGFLGGRVATTLAARGHAVTGVGRDAERGALLEAAGIAFARLDIRDASALTTATAGHAAVVHAAALSAPWGPRNEFESTNIAGSANVIAACRAAGVQRVVHVSTAGVYFTGRDRFDVREDEPLPGRQPNHYVRTKRAAERMFERASAAGLPAITLRPRAIFGPGDTALLPRLLRAHAEGRLRVPGRGDALMDLTYVDNVVHAILLALDAPADALGRAYNVTNAEPVRLWPFVGDLLAALGRPWSPRRVPYPLAFAAAAAMEVLGRTVRRGWEPPLTRYSIALLARSMTLDLTATREHLGYEPEVTMDEGLARTVSWFRDAAHQR